MSAGTAIALVTGVLLYAAWSAAAAGRWDVVGSAAVLWVTLAAAVAVVAAAWALAARVFRRKL